MMMELLNSPTNALNEYLSTHFHEFSLKKIWEIYDSIMKKEGVESAYRWTSFAFLGWDKEKLSEKAKEIWFESINSKKIQIQPEIQNLCSLFKEYSWTVYIVTASPTLIIEPLASIFHVLPKRVLGMNLKLINGKTTPEIIEPYTYGNGKVHALKNEHVHEVLLAFGDSRNDLPLLKYAKNGILFDRGDEALKRDCESLGIQIQPFFV